MQRGTERGHTHSFQTGAGTEEGAGLPLDQDSSLTNTTKGDGMGNKDQHLRGLSHIYRQMDEWMDR